MKITLKEGALIAFHFNKFSVHFGVFPEGGEVYRFRNYGKYINIKYWMWGRFTEPYDLCLNYIGFGPFMLIVIPNYGNK